jgi:hypothetical protein
MAGEVGGGIASGAASGAVLGTTILPGWGTAIGAVAGGIVGGIKGGQEKKLREQYEAKEKSIPLQDPNQVAYLDKIRRNQKALAAGTDPMTSYRMQEARNRGQQTALNLMRSSGGSTQALTSNILRANEGTNRAIAVAGADAFNKSLDLLAAEGTLVGSMADRAYNRQLSQARMLFAQQQQMKQARVDQGNAALGSIGTVSGSLARRVCNLSQTHNSIQAHYLQDTITGHLVRVQEDTKEHTEPLREVIRHGTLHSKVVQRGITNNDDRRTRNTTIQR